MRKKMERKRSILLTALIFTICFFSTGISIAATDTKSIVIKAKIDKVAKLVVDTNSITFPSVDPDEAKQVPALQNDIKVTVKARTGSMSPVNLSVVADGDLASGPDTIPVQNVVWQASGQGFLGGTLSKSTLQTAGTWKGSGVREGTFRYYLNNNWNYQRGEYQVTVTYTLTTP
jgi:hypothetical protein